MLEKAGPDGTVEVKALRAAMSQAANARFRAVAKTVIMSNSAKKWRANASGAQGGGSAASAEEGSKACAVM